MAVDPRPPEHGSHASSHTSPLWDSSCLAPGPSMASALPLITTRVHSNNHGALLGPQRFGWGEGLSGTSHQRLFRPCSLGLLWQVSHLWARSSTIVCVHVPMMQWEEYKGQSPHSQTLGMLLTMLSSVGGTRRAYNFCSLAGVHLGDTFLQVSFFLLLADPPVFIWDLFRATLGYRRGGTMLSRHGHGFSLVAQSCPTLDPMDCSPPGSSVHGISRVRILEWVAISFSRASCWPRDQSQVSDIGRWLLYRWATKEAVGFPAGTQKLTLPGFPSLVVDGWFWHLSAIQNKL